MLTDLLYRLRALLRRSQAEQDLEAELDFHIEHAIDKHVRSGKTRQEARRLARLQLQGPEQMKEHCRDARGVRVLEVVAQDGRQAIRQLRKSPLFTLCVVLTFGLCVGANTAVYSVVDALFFRPLPYPHPDKLVLVATYRGDPEFDTALDGVQLATVRDHATLLDTAAYGPTLGANLSTTDHASYIHLQRVSAGIFRILGVPLQSGHEFSRQEDVPNGPDLAVISDGLWHRAFHRAPDVIGRSITVNGGAYTVIGVTSPKFRAIPVSDFGSTDEPDLFTPLRPSTEGEGSG